MLARGIPEWFAGAMVEVMQHARTGAADATSSTVAKLLDRPFRSYGEFAHEFASAYRPD